MTPQTLTLRTATPADMAALDDLFARSYPALLKADYPPSLQVLALPLLSRANPRLLASGTYYVAEGADGALLGAGGWSRSGGPGRGQVRHVVTDKAHVRQGIGRQLLNHVMAEARRAGLRRLDCQSTLTAVPFYRACGFRALGRIDVPLGPGIVFPAVAMWTPL